MIETEVQYIITQRQLKRFRQAFHDMTREMHLAKIQCDALYSQMETLQKEIDDYDSRHDSVTLPDPDEIGME